MSNHPGKQQILARATELFRAKGYTATSIDEIVKACGITKGGLYHHFGSKEELALAAMEEVHLYFKEHIFCLIDNARSPAAAELAAFNRDIEKFFRSHPDGCLIANLSLETGISHALFSQRIRRFFDDWRACYAAVFSVLRKAPDATKLAEDALATVQGCILMYRVNGDMGPLRRQHRRLIQLLNPLSSTP